MSEQTNKTAITCTKYRDDLVFRIYELAKNGYSLKRIGEACGVTSLTLKRWMDKHVVAKKAYLRGKKLYENEGNSTLTFMDYVHGRLPRSIQRKWDKIMKLDTMQRGPERIRAFMRAQDDTVQQYIFIHALVSYNFNKSRAIRKVGIPYSKIKKWYNDSDFSTMLEFVQELKGDFFEDHLMQLCEDGDARAIIFANKTYNRERGYGQKVDVKIDKSVSHQHTISVEEANLPLKEKTKLLDQLRAKRVESTVIE